MFRSIAPPVAGALMLALLMWLGFWQLDRAEQKRALEAAYEHALASAPRAVDGARALDALPRFTPVALTGRYDAARQALLDAQVHGGRAGYRVWTPFVFADGSLVLVDRGWLAADPDRRVLPDPPVDGTRRTVRGFVAPLPRPGLRAGGAQIESGWPRRLVWPDADALRAAYGQDVSPRVVLLADSEPDGFVRDWNPVPVPPSRHVGYAVQWFGLAAALIVIAVVLFIRRRRDG